MDSFQGVFEITLL